MSQNQESKTTSHHSDLEERRYKTAKQIGKSKVHYCPDWDYMAIWDGCPEMEACTCEGLR